MYSAFAVQGLGKDGKPPTREELAPLAKTNVESLAEFEFFTFAKQGGANSSFGADRGHAGVGREKNRHFALSAAAGNPFPRKSPFVPGL